MGQVSTSLNLDKAQKVAACKLRSIYLGKLQQILVDRRSLHASIAASLPNYLNSRHMAVLYLKARTPRVFPNLCFRPDL